MSYPRIPAEFVEEVRALFPQGLRGGFEACLQVVWKITLPLMQRVEKAERLARLSEEERRQATEACEAAWRRIRDLEARPRQEAAA